MKGLTFYIMHVKASLRNICNGISVASLWLLLRTHELLEMDDSTSCWFFLTITLELYCYFRIYITKRYQILCNISWLMFDLCYNCFFNWTL